MPKLLHIADLHLGFEHRYLGDRAAERANETIRTLDSIVTWALEPVNDINGVLIAGDLFEYHDPEPLLIGRVITSLGKLVSGGKTLITVPGNHDEYSYPQSVYRRNASSWPGILVTSPVPAKVASIDMDNVTCDIHSLAFTAGLSASTVAGFDVTSSAAASGDRASAHNATRPNQTVRVAVLHATLDANPVDRSYRVDSSTLREAGIAYTALGHIHKPRETRIGDGWAVYPGSLTGKGFDDPGVNYLTAVSFPGGAIHVEQIPFPTRRIETRPVDLGRHESLTDLLGALMAESDPDLILRLELHGPRPAGFDTQHLLGRLRGCFHHLEIDDCSVGIPDGELESLIHQPTVRGLFAQLMMKRMNDASAKGDKDASERLRLALRRGLAAFECAHAARNESPDTNEEPA